MSEPITTCMLVIGLLLANIIFVYCENPVPTTVEGKFAPHCHVPISIRFRREREEAEKKL